jgi:hypothetical protein
MSRFRSLVEHYREATRGMVACPHCGTMLPCGDSDQPARMNHYQHCTGKPQPVEAVAKPMIVGDIDYTAMSDDQLKSLRLSMKLKLMLLDNPARRNGVSLVLRPTYESIRDAASAELSRREESPDAN